MSRGVEVRKRMRTPGREVRSYDIPNSDQMGSSNLVWPRTCMFSSESRPEASTMAKGFVAVTVERCKGCGFCVEFCPTHVLSLSSAFNSKGYHPPHVVAPEKCSGCGGW